jgi:hypothetical protein
VLRAAGPFSEVSGLQKEFKKKDFVAVSSTNGGAILPLDSAGLYEDVKRPLGSFVEVRSFGLLFLICGIGIGEFELAVSEDFESVMEVGTGSEDLGSEARAGVIDFHKLEALRGSVRYGGFNVGGVTTSEQEHGEQCKAAERTHTGLKRNRGG